MGPWAPDGRYARVGFDLELPWGQGESTPTPDRAGRPSGLIVEWARAGDRGVVARITFAGPGALVMRPYLPWDWQGAWEVSGHELRGRTEGGWHAAVVVSRPGRVVTQPSDGDELVWDGAVTVELAAALDRVAGSAMDAARGLAGGPRTAGAAIEGGDSRQRSAAPAGASPDARPLFHRRPPRQRPRRLRGLPP